MIIRLTKQIIAYLILGLLAACVSMPQSASYLDRAELAISQRNWQIAYRFLEDGFVSSDQQTKARALSIYKSHPLLRDAAMETFTVDKIMSTVRSYDPKTGLEVEKKRLSLFAQVALPADLAKSYSNYEAAEKLAQSMAEKERDRLANEESIRRRLLEAEAAEYKKRVAEESKARADLVKRLEEAQAAAFFRCNDRLDCEKAFALTQIFIATRSDMKIQMANDTLIQTFNPNTTLAMGATAMKMPRGGASADIVLSLSCKSDSSVSYLEACQLDAIRLYREFPKFMADRFVR